MWLAHQHQHWNAAFIPLVGSIVWLGMILTMLLVWITTGKPKYVSQDGKIAYISDVGAGFLKPWFNTGCIITAVSLFLSLAVDRLWRHNGRLPQTMRRRETWLSWLSMFWCAVGGAGLVLLSFFDTRRHPSLHRVFLLVFVVGVIISALFTVLEYAWISRDYGGAKKLRIAYIMKGSIALILAGLAIAFGAELDNQVDVGAILEWTIAFGFTFYLLTFVYDLRIAKDRHRGELSREHLVAAGHFTPRGKRARQREAEMAQVI